MQPDWWRRLRWRARGAWLWPAFIVLTIADGVLLHLLPFAGEGIDVLPGMLLAGIFNLIAIVLLSALAGVGLRRLRPDLPRTVATNYGGTALLFCVTGLLLIGGLLHKPALDDRDRDFAAQRDAVREYVATRAPAIYRAHVTLADTWQIEDHLYRTCVPGGAPNARLCLLVDTNASPPTVKQDHSRAANDSFAAPGGAGP